MKRFQICNILRIEPTNNLIVHGSLPGTSRCVVVFSDGRALNYTTTIATPMTQMLKNAIKSKHFNCNSFCKCRNTHHNTRTRTAVSASDEITHQSRDVTLCEGAAWALEKHRFCVIWGLFHGAVRALDSAGKTNTHNATVYITYSHLMHSVFY